MSIIKELTENKIMGIPMEMSTETLDTPYESFIGCGMPYLPNEAKRPEGMFPFLQINFAEVPDNGILPKKGIFQFWCKPDAELWEGEENSSEYKVFYFEDLEESVETIEYPDEAELSEEYPIILPTNDSLCCKIKFQEPKGYVAYYDTVEMEDIVHRELSDEDYDYYEEIMEEDAHFMLGAPQFTQGEHRDSKKTINIFQIASLDDFMIGDAGIFHLFANIDDIKAGNLSRIYPYWDCC